MKQTNICTDIISGDRRKLSLPTDAFEHIPEVIYCTDRDGKLRYINKYGRHFIGQNKEQLLGKSLLEIHPELLPERWQTATESARKKGQWIIKFEQSRYTKTPAPLEITLSHQSSNDDEYFICITRVINRLDHSEQLLNMISQSTASYSGLNFFKVLMQHMAEAMHVDKAFITECMDQPPTRVRMLAFWSADNFADNMEYDLNGTPCDIVINRKQDCLVKENLGKEYPKEKGFAESYYGVPIFNTEGDQVIGHMAFLDDQKLSVDGLDCTVFEILASRAAVELQRLHAEDALKNSEANYRLLVENQTDLILRIDTEKKLAFVSPSCCARLGKKESELIHTGFFSLIHNDEISPAHVAWKKAQRTPYKSSCKLRTLTSQGWCWFSWILKSVVDDNGKINEVIAVGRDISERVRAEDHARETIYKLAHVGRVNSMGEMASSIAHELNQPLTAILSFAQASRRMLDSEYVTDIEEYKIVLERIASNAELAGNIIQRVRGFIRKNQTPHAPIDLTILIHDVSDLLSTELRHGDILLSLKLDDNLPHVSGDAIQIQQVLVNVVRNAIEAIIEHDTKTREISILAKAEQTDNISNDTTTVIIEVSDSGPGISAGIKKQLFTAFITSKPEGLGIGLSICHTIIEAHGGTLGVESKPGKGAKFSFTLTAFKED